MAIAAAALIIGTFAVLASGFWYISHRSPLNDQSSQEARFNQSSPATR
jgi:hypothetical protein